MTTGEFAKRAAIVVGIALVPWLVWHLFDVILITIGGLLLATLLEICAKPFYRLRFRRGFALVGSGFLIAVVVGGAVYLFGTGVASELQEVLNRVEEAQKTISQSLKHSQLGATILAHLQGANVPLGELIGGAFRISARLLIAIVVTVFVGIYLAAQPALYRGGVSKLFPARWRENADQTIDHVAAGLRLWLFGQLIDMLIIGVLSTFAVWLIGLPSPLALGVIAGVVEFVPYLGPIIASVPAILVAVTIDLSAMLWTILAYVLIHQVEGQIVMPMIQRQMVYIPPALMLLSIVSITSLFGLPGTVFAAPLTVVLFVLVNKLYVRDSLGEEAALPGEEAGEAQDADPGI